MYDHIFILIVVMILGGAAGGLASWLLAPVDEQDGAGVRFGVKGYIAVGIVAAFVVPLFLSMAQSELISPKGDAALEAGDIFIFVGFCIIAGFSARGFIQTISDRLLAEVQQVREQQIEASDQMEELRDNVAERSPVHDAESGLESVAEIDPETRSVAEALSTDEVAALKATALMTMRTRTGIARDGEIATSRISSVLEKLIDKGLIERTQSERTGNLRFRITARGIDALKAISA